MRVPIVARLGLSAPKVPIERPAPICRSGSRRGVSAVAAPRQPVLAVTVAVAVAAAPLHGSWRPIELPAL